MTTIHTFPENKQNTGNPATENTPINTTPEAPGAENITPNKPVEQRANGTKPNVTASDDPTEKITESVKPKNPASTGNKGNDDKNTNPEQLRRLVTITGDKGGVGKSTFARGLAQIYMDNAVGFVGLDADNSNPHLIRFYGEKADIYPLEVIYKVNLKARRKDLWRG